MRSINAFIRLALFVLPVLASENLLLVKRADGEVVKDSYVVLMKDGPGVASVDTIAESMPDSAITHRWSIVDGFTANLTDGDLEMLKARNDVLSISENAIARTTTTQ
jgi:hypothetical protein